MGHFATAKKCARSYFSKKLIPKTSPNSSWAETSKLTIESSRTTGGIAAILLATGVVSQVVSLFQYMFGSQGAANLVVVGVSGILGILVLVGLIMFLVSMHGFSQDYSEPHIFEYLVNGIIVTIVLGIITLIIALAVVISNASSLFPIFSSSAASQSQMSSSVWKSILPLLPVFSVVGLIWILFNVRSLNLLGDKSKVVLFRTGTKVLLSRRSFISRGIGDNSGYRVLDVDFLQYGTANLVGSRRVGSGRGVGASGNRFLQSPNVTRPFNCTYKRVNFPICVWTSKILPKLWNNYSSKRRLLLKMRTKAAGR